MGLGPAGPQVGIGRQRKGVSEVTGAGLSSPKQSAQGVGAVTFGQVAPLKRLAIRLLPSL